MVVSIKGFTDLKITLIGYDYIKFYITVFLSYTYIHCWGVGNGSFFNILLNIYLAFLKRKQML